MKSKEEIWTRIEGLKQRIQENIDYMNTNELSTFVAQEVYEDNLELNSRMNILKWVLE